MNVILGDNDYRLKSGEKKITLTIRYDDQERYVDIISDADLDIKKAIDFGVKNLKTII